MGIGKVDAYGLPEYYVTDVVTELAGSNVRMICGVHRGGEVHWLYSVVMPAESVIIASQTCREVAEAAFTCTQLLAAVIH